MKNADSPGLEREAPPVPESSPLPSRGKLLLYWILVFLCLAGGMGIYSLWRTSFERAHPKLAAAHPFVYAPVMEVTALKLWWEDPLPGTPGIAPEERDLSRIRRVKKGDVLAPKVRAPFPGFFVPWRDGLEEIWNFSSLWRHEVAMERAYLLQRKVGFPKAPPGGRMVKIPQDLRLLFRLPRTPEVERMLRSEILSLALEREGRPVEGVVQAERNEGSYVCVMLSFPNFPREALLSRVEKVYLFFPEEPGVLIPQSAVDLRNRREGVYIVTGGTVYFREIRGKPVDASRYLVTRGLRPGELVMENAQIAEEGRLRIW